MKKKERLEDLSNLPTVYDRARTWYLSAPSLALTTAFTKMEALTQWRQHENSILFGIGRPKFKCLSISYNLCDS